MPGLAGHGRHLDSHRGARRVADASRQGRHDKRRHLPEACRSITGPDCAPPAPITTPDGILQLLQFVPAQRRPCQRRLACEPDATRGLSAIGGICHCGLAWLLDPRRLAAWPTSFPATLRTIKSWRHGNPSVARRRAGNLEEYSCIALPLASVPSWLRYALLHVVNQQHWEPALYAG